MFELGGVLAEASCQRRREYDGDILVARNIEKFADMEAKWYETGTSRNLLPERQCARTIVGIITDEREREDPGQNCNSCFILGSLLLAN